MTTKYESLIESLAGAENSPYPQDIKLLAKRMHDMEFAISYIQFTAMLIATNPWIAELINESTIRTHMAWIEKLNEDK